MGKIHNFIMCLLGLVSGFTWIIFGVYLLPRVLELPIKHIEILRIILPLGIACIGIFITIIIMNMENIIKK